MLLEGKNLPFIEIAMNRSTSAASGTSPFVINYRYSPIFADELATISPTQIPAVEDRVPQLVQGHQRARTTLVSARLQQAKQANKRRRVGPALVEGDNVLLSTQNLPLSTSYPKFSPTFIGPFSIIRAWPNTDNYELELLKGLSKLHPVYQNGGKGCCNVRNDETNSRTPKT